jgi:ribonuclease T2
MQQYWVDINGDDETFWAHEWGKHGTCINTITPSCYTNYTPQEEVGDFFQKVVDLFKGLDTYKVCNYHPSSETNTACLILFQALAAAGITPDSSKTYSLSDIQAALSNLHGGASVYIGCSSGSLNQVWYFYNVAGNAIDGQYQAVDTRKWPTVEAFAIWGTV